MPPPVRPTPITRRQFLAVSAALGLGGVVGCGNDETADPPTGSTTSTGPSLPTADRRVIVVGAGAAGMATGHLLVQRGVDVQIVEAAPTHGGRVKRADDFVDFPIPLGGEWLHASADTLARIVDDDSVTVDQPLQAYAPDDPVALVVDDELVTAELGRYDDLKLVGATWLDFFDEYVVPGIEPTMVFDTQIVRIDHGGDPVVLTDAAGGTWETDHVIVTAPMQILREGDIEFVPPLPESHQRALDAANIWTGMKVFLEFDEAFYPVFLEFADDRGADGQRAYYDAAYGQDSDANVLGLFLVGELAEPYQALDPGDELRDHILAELDALYDGAASASYLQHISQNWADEPFIRAAYLEDDAQSWISTALAQPLGDRVHFAGCSYTRFDDWSAVHTAVRSARDAVDHLLA